MPDRVRSISKLRVGFTLVELMVVVGIIAVLLGVLLPSLSAARRAAQATRCQSNLRQIGMAMRLYAAASRDLLNYSVSGKANWITTWAPAGQANALRLAKATDTTAYWGVAYLPFIASCATAEAEGADANRIVDYARGIWLCPSSNGMSAAYGVDPTYPISYAINGYLTGTSGATFIGRNLTYRKLSSFHNASDVIIVQDAVVTRLVDTNWPATGEAYKGAGNTLSSWTPGNPTNLRDWRPPNGPAFLAGLHPDPLREYFRHSRRCQALYVDGHVSAISESLGTDIPQWAYTGKRE